MKVISVKDVYNVTQISKTNVKVWEMLYDIAEREQGDILFDFRDITLDEPWNNDMFLRLLRNERVHIKVYSSEKLKNTIDIACNLGRIKSGRVFNEDEILNIEMKVEKNVHPLTYKFESNIIVEGDKARLNVYDIVSQIGSVNTVNALKDAILNVHNELGISNFIVDLGYISCEGGTIHYIANAIKEMSEYGIVMRVISEEDEIISKLTIYNCLSSDKKITPIQRVKYFKQFVPRGTIGVLVRFKDTRRVDEFGRKGDGIPIMSRVAIFKNIVRNKNNIYAIFDAFDGDYFYTRLHYAMEYDGEYLDKLVVETMKVPIGQLGLYDLYLGSLYHFNRPIQYDPNDLYITYIPQGEGIRKEYLTLPEYIKIVLDDHNYDGTRDYDETSLIEAIEISRNSI